jgi:hypothetical protein
MRNGFIEVKYIRDSNAVLQLFPGDLAYEALLVVVNDYSRHFIEVNIDQLGFDLRIGEEAHVSASTVKFFCQPQNGGKFSGHQLVAYHQVDDDIVIAIFASGFFQRSRKA